MDSGMLGVIIAALVAIGGIVSWAIKDRKDALAQAREDAKRALDAAHAERVARVAEVRAEAAAEAEHVSQQNRLELDITNRLSSLQTVIESLRGEIRAASGTLTAENRAIGERLAAVETRVTAQEVEINSQRDKLNRMTATMASRGSNIYSAEVAAVPTTRRTRKDI